MSTSAPRPKSSAGQAIFWAGLVAGILDITAAFVTWAPRGVTPTRILQGISSGLLGANAFQGGAATAALGLVLHFFIAYSAATVFYIASRRIAMMTQKPILSGVLYGVCVYLVMYWVVMPLSHIRRGPFSVFNTIVAIITHMVCVGLPIALMVRKYARADAR
jgi:uncharacterized membrane protein YagU involved in acid resistance